MRDVIIVGTGFSGLGMAIALKRAGRDNFVILEKAADLGGTWRDNTYPGCACDTQSLVYSFSFEPNPDWSRMFPRQEEIWGYLRRCAEKYQLGPHIRYGTELRDASFDAGRAAWTVTTTDGEQLEARAIVLGIGALHVPSYPNIPGLETFGGRAFHSAEWEHDVDLTGKRVAVIGTGASSVQLLPHVARLASHVDLYQRTPPWIVPKFDRRITRVERALFRRVPALQRLYRASIFWRLESRALGFVHPKLMAATTAVAKWHLRRQVRSKELRAQLTPNYTIGCKRILISNDYYPTVSREHVSVITDRIAEVTETGVRTADGQHRDADVIIYGTGFHVTDAFARHTVTGRDGATLNDVWAAGMETYLGISVARFPNAFFLLGPNTGLGHNTVVYMIEQQIQHVLQALALLDGATTVEVRPEAQQQFNADIQARHTRAVWNLGGCKSWYLDAQGVNRVIWPGFAWQYRNRTRRLNPAHYLIGDSRHIVAEAPLDA